MGAVVWPFLAIAAFIASGLSATNAADVTKPVDNCEGKPLQIIFLFDLFPDNKTDFTKQQERVIETINHLDTLTQSRPTSFGFVVFHRMPVLLSPLNSPKSGDSSKVTEQVQSVRPRRHADTSPAKALDLAAEQIEKNGQNGAQSLVFLVHDGLNNDLIAETLEAVDRLRGHNVSVFAISGSNSPNLLGLAGYTKQRERIYSSKNDKKTYLTALNKVVDTCAPTVSGKPDEIVKLLANSLNDVAFKASENVTSVETEDSSDNVTVVFHQNSRKVLDIASIECLNNGKIDLMIVLDTSGSVFHAFEEERELAAKLVSALEPTSLETNAQVGLVSFASEPVVCLPLSHGRSVETIVNRIHEIEFTGKNTRIADAVELALMQLEHRQRPDARQFFVLITDGHGQEYWNQAQSAGRRLLESSAEVFVATMSTDYNLPEMLLYAGDESRVFFGSRVSSFLPSVAGLLNRCAGKADYKANGLSELHDGPPTNATKSKEGFDNSLIIKFDNSLSPIVGQSMLIETHIIPSTDAEKQKPQLEAIEFSIDNTTSSEEKLETTESSAEIASFNKEAAQKRADDLRKFLETQKGLPSTSDCDTDILFVVERTQRSTFDFGQQLDLAASVVEGISDDDVEDGKTRFGLITFSKKPRILVSLTSNDSRTDFINKLKSVQPYHSVGALDRAVTTVADEIATNRRNDTRVVVIFVASGRIPDESKKTFVESVHKFNNVSNVDIFSVSLNPFNDASNLRKLTGDKWRVFIDGRVRQFSKEVRSSLTSCALAAREGHEVSTENVEHEPASEIEKVEHLAIFAKSLQNADPTCGQDPIDLVLILDVSTSVANEFDAQKRVAVDLLKQAAAIDVGKRVRVGITTFAEFGRTVISLDNNLSLDELLFVLDRIEHIGGQTSAVAGISQSLADVQQHRRNGARLVVVILSDGNSRDGWSRVQKAGNALKKSGADVFAIALSSDRSVEELAIYTDSKKRVFSGDKANDFVFASSKIVYGCSVDARERNLADITVQAQENDEIETLEKLVAKPAEKDEKTEFPEAESLNVTSNGNETFTVTELASLTESSTNGSTVAETASSTTASAVSGNSTKESVTETVSLSDSETLATESATILSTESATVSTTESSASLSTESATSPSTESSTVLSTESTTSLLTTTSINSSEETTTTSSSTLSPTTKPTFSLTELTTEKELHVNPLFSDDCTVDLMFIIDTSQSVANEFQKQLQFAVDLVKRLPDDDFDQRVSVAAVSFFQTARIEFPFGKLREKSTVLDALFKVEHTGGSTSAVSGVELAVDEIVRGRRPGARLMVVLVSDGNSQDHWDKVLDAAGKLRAVNADVYAVTVSHDYFFRELELYAGNKWFVYIDARIRQFLDEAEMSVVECKNPSIPASAGRQDTTTVGPQTKLESIASTLASISPSTTTPSPVVPDFLLSGPGCQKDIVDLFIILDTSTSVEKEFYAEKNFALDLVKVLPEADFTDRIRISLIKFNDKAELQFGLGDKTTRNDVLYELERVEHTGGQTSLVSGVSLALNEIDKKQRNGSRLVTVIISDGNSQDEWTAVQTTALKLKHSGSEIYAVTLSEKYFFDELKEYTGNERHVYADEKVESFIQDVGLSVVSCPGRLIDKVTLAPNVEVSATPTTLAIASTTTPAPSKLQKVQSNPEFALARDDSDETHDSGNVDVAQSVAKPTPGKCKYNKMDLIIILDASSSRESVFEHQRELALSLIERLPINKDDTHVATGINSFTNTPTLRQTLGLGRDKLMVRHAIEDIKYNGGSTLTSKAVELAVTDLERGRRPDALQVVVLMNDGMSQDPWDNVLMSAEKLKATNAERFGVALGDDVDLRELRHYVGREDRIYRDGSTERFLSDIVALLNGERDCEPSEPTETVEDDGFDHATDDISDCNKPQLDVVVVFDATDNSKNMDNPEITSNKYLLLDVLGSLPTTDDVKISVTSFGANPKLEHRFTDDQSRDALFERIESIESLKEQGSYAKAVHSALDYYNGHKRPNARGLLLIVGAGNSTDESEERSLASNLVRKTKGLECHAVDSSKQINERVLATFTGDPKRVYNYDRNADFAKELLRLATLGTSDMCVEERKKQVKVEPAASLDDEQTYSTSAPAPRNEIVEKRLRDIQVAPISADKEFFDDKIVVTTAKSTFRPTTVVTSTQPPTTTTTTTEVPTTRAARLSSVAASSSFPIPRLLTTTTAPARRFTVTQALTEAPAPFVPGCLIDLLIILDSSGSVEETFTREKELAAGIIDRLRIGPDNARVAIIKFAAKEKVRTLFSFDDLVMSKPRLMNAIRRVPFSSGTTAIDAALLHAVTEYSPLKGARPGKADPIAIIFTDGFGQHDTAKESALLRAAIPNLYAVAINHIYPISRVELEKITGDPRRVYTDANIDEFHKLLTQKLRTC